MTPIELLIHSSGKYPAKTAVSHKERSLTYREFFQRVERLADAMARAANMRPGDRVAIWAGNCIEYLEVMFAAFAIGAIPELCNARWSFEVLQSTLRYSNARALFIDSPESLPVEVDATREIAENTLVVAFKGESSRCMAYGDLLARGNGNPIIHEARENDTALLLYTSGTTSLPKGVMLSNKALISHVLVNSMEERWSHDDVCLAIFPFCHVAGFAVFKSIFEGASLVIGDSTRPEEIAQLVARHKVTRASLPPTLLLRMLDGIENSGNELRTLKYITYGSSHMDAALIQRCTETLGCGFYQAYGATETAAALTALSPEDHQNPGLLDTVGKPILGVSIRIVDEKGRECPTGSVGEVIAQTPSIMKGYLGREALTCEVLRDGWYSTRDMGFLDESGYLHLKGRRDGMIISGGENIFPQEIADCIATLEDAIREVAVVGVEHAAWGQCPAAFVVKADEADINAETIAEHCAARLGRYKKPRYVYFLDALPRNALGKIAEGELRLLHERRLCKSPNP